MRNNLRLLAQLCSARIAANPLRRHRAFPVASFRRRSHAFKGFRQFDDNLILGFNRGIAIRKGAKSFPALRVLSSRACSSWPRKDDTGWQSSVWGQQSPIHSINHPNYHSQLQEACLMEDRKKSPPPPPITVLQSNMCKIAVCQQSYLRGTAHDRFSLFAEI